jgi:hypothetical protein
MKIEKIELYQLDLPYAGGTYRLAVAAPFRSFSTSSCSTMRTSS